MKLTVNQLRQAHGLVLQIADLERAREDAKDCEAFIDLAEPTHVDPLGKAYAATVMIPVHAGQIRMALTDKLTPLYTELRAMGIELDLT